MRQNWHRRHTVHTKEFVLLIYYILMPVGLYDLQLETLVELVLINLPDDIKFFIGQFFSLGMYLINIQAKEMSEGT